MRREGKIVLVAVALVLAIATADSQSGSTPSKLTERGHVDVSGQAVPYVIHRLPVSSFPQLPDPIAAKLEQTGCMIPQTYQAHRPENVIHGSLERPGSSDWAVLCAADGTVKLMVFFGSSLSSPTVLASEPETARLETHDRSGVLGFGWGIDPISPRRMREAQAGMEHRPSSLDHDALADVFVEKSTIYHFFTRNRWTVVDTTD